MPGPDLAERLHAFRSVGGNCEFGFVQRYGGVEPSGLLRFSYTPIADLIRALDTDFRDYGAPYDLELQTNTAGTYYCHSRSTNIWLSTEQQAGSVDPAVLLDRQYGRVVHLKRLMMEDLAAGSRMLVRKLDQGETPDDVERLARAVARHGRSPLLTVREDGNAWHPGAELRRLGDRVYAGSVRRFAPMETAWAVDLEPWLILCDRAYAVHHRLPEAGTQASPAAAAIPLRSGLRRHRAQPLASGLSAFTKAADTKAFDPSKVYVFSAWVWIPPGCRASRIFAVTGHERLGWSDADLAVRGQWQRVWAAGRIRRESDPVPIGLAMFGDGADRFWSFGAQVHEGVVPASLAPPRVVPEPAPLRWLTSARGRIA